MFGHVRANTACLNSEELMRYRAVYCGLCRTLKERHGQFSGFGLSYDLTFLTLLLTSLYEPEENRRESRCIMGCCKRHPLFQSNISIYAADMTVALTYHKCLDDWKDEHKLYKKIYALLLSNEYKAVRAKWPVQCESIERCIDRISAIEDAHENQPDAAANCFGQLMSELFLYKKDQWEEPLRGLGFHLGRYIYIADAAADHERDRKKKNYNPLNSLSSTPKELRPTLEVILGDASKYFEYLPLVKDSGLLRNILYSGIWNKYDRAMEQKKKGIKHDRRPVQNTGCSTKCYTGRNQKSISP